MKSKIKEYVKTWENRCYSEGIPDEAPTEINHLVPSYKKICIAILTNDHILKSLGYSGKESKYYGVLKRIELDERNKYKQLKLF